MLKVQFCSAADQDEANTDWVVLALRLNQLHLNGNTSQAFRYFVFGMGFLISLIRRWLLAPLLMSSAIALMVQVANTACDAHALVLNLRFAVGIHC